jgi:hypothetical protein
MPLVEVLKDVDTTLYPDIVEAGSINAALSKSLADIGSHLVADESPVNKFMPYVCVEEGSRFSQTQLGSGQRLFLTDFWSQGVMFGNTSSDNLETIARAIHIWIAEKSSIEKMSKLFKSFSATESGKALEAGTYVEYQWKSLIESWKSRENPFKIRSHKQLFRFLFSLTLQQKARHLSGYFEYRRLGKNNKEYSPIPFINAAMKKPELRQLFPFTSLSTLCFSRTTGYPFFTKDCPSVASQGNGKYCVYASGSHEVIGEGTIDEVLEIAIKHLPPNCGAAVNGTADDFVL